MASPERSRLPVALGVAILSFCAWVLVRGWTTRSADPKTADAGAGGSAPPSTATAPAETHASALLHGAVVDAEAPGAGPEVPDPEAALMEKLRFGGLDPTTRLAMAREGNLRFRSGPAFEERTAMIVDALVSLKRIAEARAEAERFLEKHPDGRYSKAIAALTGVHVRPGAPSASGGY